MCCVVDRHVALDAWYVCVMIDPICQLCICHFGHLAAEFLMFDVC